MSSPINPILNLIQFLVLTSLSLRSNLIFPSHLRLGLPRSSFPVGFPLQILKALLPPSILTIYSDYFNLLDLFTLTPLGKENTNYEVFNCKSFSLQIFTLFRVKYLHQDPVLKYVCEFSLHFLRVGIYSSIFSYSTTQIIFLILLPIVEFLSVKELQFCPQRY